MSVEETIKELFQNSLIKGVISNPKGETEFRKIRFRQLEDAYQIEKLTQKQAFHSECEKELLADTVTEFIRQGFRQVDAWSEDTAFCLKISKKGKATLLKKRQETAKDI